MHIRADTVAINTSTVGKTALCYLKKTMWRNCHQMVIRYKHCINKAKTMTDGLINMYTCHRLIILPLCTPLVILNDHDKAKVDTFNYYWIWDYDTKFLVNVAIHSNACVDKCTDTHADTGRRRSVDNIKFWREMSIWLKLWILK